MTDIGIKYFSLGLSKLVKLYHLNLWFDWQDIFIISLYYKGPESKEYAKLVFSKLVEGRVGV